MRVIASCAAARRPRSTSSRAGTGSTDRQAAAARSRHLSGDPRRSPLRPSRLSPPNQHGLWEVNETRIHLHLSAPQSSTANKEPWRDFRRRAAMCLTPATARRHSYGRRPNRRRSDCPRDHVRPCLTMSDRPSQRQCRGDIGVPTSSLKCVTKGAKPRRQYGVLVEPRVQLSTGSRHQVQPDLYAGRRSRITHACRGTTQPSVPRAFRLWRVLRAACCRPRHSQNARGMTSCNFALTMSFPYP